MKAKDLIQLFEYGKAFKTDKAKRSRVKKNIDFDTSSITMLLHQRLEEAHMLEKLLKDHTKIHKEEKKEEKSQWSMAHISYFLCATFPITAPLYVVYLRHMLG